MLTFLGNLNINQENLSSDKSDSPLGGFSIGNLLGNIFAIPNDSKSNTQENNQTNSSKKAKPEKRKKESKKRVLDIYGTNLTNKAKDGLLDKVVRKRFRN